MESSTSHNALESIEIGTVGFNLMEIPLGTRGVIVEPVKKYLDISYEKLTKAHDNSILAINAAVFPAKSTDTECDIYYMDPSKIPDDFKRLAGTSLVNRIHPEIKRYVELILKDTSPNAIDNYVLKETVPVISFTDIIKQADDAFGPITEIGTIKFDTEGMGTGLAISAAHELHKIFKNEKRDLFPSLIMFESNHLSARCDVDTAISVWRSHGYTLVVSTVDTILKKYR